MAQSETTAGDVGNPADSNPADAFNAIAEEMLGESNNPEDEEEAPLEGDEPDAELDDETDIEEEADDLPPIEAPVSWDAEAKAKFAELPRELQETVTKREAERERFVQQKSQEATQARQSATQQAQAELAQINAAYAQQLQEVANSFQVSEPDPMLQVSDPVAYAQQMRAYQQANAQRSQAQHAAQQHAQQAQALAYQAEQAAHAEQHRIIVEQFPEYTDPTTGPKLRAELSTVAKEMGYSDELIAQARASDILAMRTAAEWKAKAARYDALQSNKMAKVRAAKGLPKVATPGVSRGSDQVRAQRANAAFDTAKSSNNREVQGAAFFDYLKATGQV